MQISLNLYFAYRYQNNILLHYHHALLHYNGVSSLFFKAFFYDSHQTQND